RVAVAILDRDRSRAVLERDFLAARRFNDELLLPILVVEGHLHAIARTKTLLEIITPAVHRLRRSVATVPQPSNDVGPPRIPSFKPNQDLVIHIRDEPTASVFPTHQRGQARPGFIPAAGRVRRP